MASDEALQMEIRLWDYIDGRANPDERTAVEQLLLDRAEWAVKYSELLETNEQLQALETEQPSLRFTKNVMEEIAKYNIAPATKQYINKNIIRCIGGFFVVSISALVLYMLSGFNWGSGAAPSQSTFIDLTKTDFGSFFNSSYVSFFMIVNVVLGLLLLDRYLHRKKGNLEGAA